MLCAVIGILVTAAVVLFTEYFTGTGYKPVQGIAKIHLEKRSPRALFKAERTLGDATLPLNGRHVVGWVGSIAAVAFRSF